MRIGIIGLNVNNMELNYGTLLHTWAFIEFLKQSKIATRKDVEIINYYPRHSLGMIRKYPIVFYIKSGMWKKALKSVFYVKEYAKRYDLFEAFKEKYLDISQKYYPNTLNDAKLPYDCVVVEADTVWSKLEGKFEPAYFLALDSMKDMKKIAYAPDTGVPEITENDRKEMSRMIQSIGSISCRGFYPQTIISQCTKKKVEVVVDPTLLIDEAVYDTIASPRLIKDKYILLYHVGYDRAMIDAVYSYAKEKGIKVLELTSRVRKDSVFKFDRKNYVRGVEDFVSAVKYAECIFTNSFHGICLSLVYKKDFYAFARKGYKIQDLCKMAGLSNRVITTGEWIAQDDIDYALVKNCLSQWIEKSQKWLINSFDSEK